MSENKDLTPKEIAARLDAQDAIIEQLATENEELKAKLSAAPGNSVSVNKEEEVKVPELPKDTFKVEGKVYRFKNRSFLFQGKKRFAADCIKDAELLSNIVKHAPGIVELAKKA